jgi:hypothetical protein
MEHFFLLASVLLFILLQAMVINGAFEAFRGKCLNDIEKGRICDGNIFYKLNPEFFERNKDKTWAKPFFGCVKCMASVWGAITFWPTAILLFGFHWEQFGIFVMDVFALVFVNFYLFKKV